MNWCRPTGGSPAKPTNPGTPVLQDGRRLEEHLLPVYTRAAGLCHERSLGAWRRELTDAEDHKFSRANDRHANLCHHLTKITQLRRIGFGIALHVKRLLGRGAKERAPRQTLVRKAVMLRVIFCHNPGSLGSKTTHCVPSSIDLRMNSGVAPDVDVLQIGVGVSAHGARAPYRNVAVEVADAVDPSGFNPSCCALLIAYLRPIAPTTTSLAGALCTPRSLSTRASRFRRGVRWAACRPGHSISDRKLAPHGK